VSVSSIIYFYNPDHKTAHAHIQRVIKKKVAVVLTAAILSAITPRRREGEKKSLFVKREERKKREREGKTIFKCQSWW
jgi:hypothetical protein